MDSCVVPWTEGPSLGLDRTLFQQDSAGAEGSIAGQLGELKPILVSSNFVVLRQHASSNLRFERLNFSSLANFLS